MKEKNSNGRKYRINIHKDNFKWNINPPIWASVYIGSSDFIYHFKEIIKQLKFFKKEEIELVTIIGGL